jgi:hypothetical protein
MSTRNLSVPRGAYVYLDPLRIDADKLKKAKRILRCESDVQAVNKALTILIANEEMESAIEKAFGTIPYFKVR